MAELLTAWVSRRPRMELVSIADRTRHFSEHSEQPFLELGQALQRIHSRARTLQEAATGSARQYSDEVLASWLPRLQTLVHGIEHRLQSSDEQLRFIDDAIQKIAASFLASRSSLRELNGHVLTLRTLATLTRIESARLARDARGILVLAEEVGQQAENIAKRAEVFLNQSESLTRGLAEVRQRIEQLDRSESLAGSLALRRVAAVLDSVVEQRDRTRARLEQSAELSNEVARHTGEVVASLQFHDITRQRMEHVAATLQQSSRSRARPRAPLLRLLAAQVEEASRDLSEASQRTTDSLHAIAGTTRRLADELAGPDRLDDASGARSSRVTGLEQQLEQAIPALKTAHQGADRIAAEVRALSERLAECISLQHTLTTLASEVDSITEAVKRVGINASIKATTFGNEGAALSALARAILNFAASVSGQSVEILRVLTDMDDVSLRIREIAAPDVSPAGGTQGAQADELVELLEAVRSRLAEQTRKKEQLQAESNALAEEIAGTAESFRARDTLSEDMARIQARLLRLASRAAGQADGRSGGADATLRELASSYTMEQERTTHQRLARENGGADPVALALNTQAATTLNLPGAGDSALGANVELF